MLLGIVLFGYALVVPLLGTTTEGGRCGSAWHAARHPATRACERAADRVLRHAGYAGAAGLALLVGVAVWPVREHRPPLADPLGGSR